MPYARPGDRRRSMAFPAGLEPASSDRESESLATSRWEHQREESRPGIGPGSTVLQTMSLARDPARITEQIVAELLGAAGDGVSEGN